MTTKTTPTISSTSIPIINFQRNNNIFACSFPCRLVSSFLFLFYYFSSGEIFNKLLRFALLKEYWLVVTSIPISLMVWARPQLHISVPLWRGTSATASRQSSLSWLTLLCYLWKWLSTRQNALFVQRNCVYSSLLDLKVFILHHLADGNSISPIYLNDGNSNWWESILIGKIDSYPKLMRVWFSQIRILFQPI